MKTNFTSKNKLVFLFILFSIHLFSQDPLSYNLQFYQGITGIDLEESKVDFLGQTTYSVEYGNDISLGIGFNYFFDKKRKTSSSGAILWNYYSFQRREEIRYSFVSVGAPIVTFYESNNQYFQAHSFLFPMKLNRQLGVLSFSLGLVPRLRLQTKITYDIIRETTTGIMRPVTTLLTQYQFKAGDLYPAVFGPTEIVDLEYKIDLQYLMGVNYHVNSQFTIHVEFRNLVLENKLMFIENEIGNPNSGTISLGVSWNFYKNEKINEI